MRVYVAETTNKKWQTLMFEGSADQRLKAQIPEILDHLTHQTILDIGKLKSMDQAGLQAWLELVHGIDADIAIFMCNCPSHFIDKVNLIPQLLDNIQLTSLYLPVNCSNCHSSFEILLENLEHSGAQQAHELITNKNCSKCNDKSLTPVVDLAIYLSFLEKRQTTQTKKGHKHE